MRIMIHTVMMSPAYIARGSLTFSPIKVTCDEQGGKKLASSRNYQTTYQFYKQVMVLQVRQEYPFSPMHP